jgi:uncharacterized protein (DUF4415 family)
MDRKLIPSTPEEDEAIARALADNDPDDAPDLVEALADGRLGYVGRGLDALGKVFVHVDIEVVRRFKAQGPDWEDRLNEALRRAVGL